MKATVSGKFLQSLSGALRTLGFNTVAPELNNVFLEFGGDASRLTAFSPEAVLRATIQGGALEPVCVRMRADDYERLASALSGAAAELEVGGAFVKFRDGSLKGRIPGLAAEKSDEELLRDKLALFEFEPEEVLELTPEQVELVDRAARPMAALSKSFGSGSSVWILPYRRADGEVVTVVGGAARPGMGFVVLPQAVGRKLALDERALDFARLADTDGRVRFEFSERMVRIGAQSGLMRVGVLPVNTFRETMFSSVWDRVWAGVRHWAVFSRDEFVDFITAARKVLRFSAKKDALGSFVRRGSELLFEARDDFGGWMAKEFRILEGDEGDGETEKVMFWLSNLEFLSAFRSERMTLRWAGAQSPVVFSEDEGVGGRIADAPGDVWYVMMPCAVTGKGAEEEDET